MQKTDSILNVIKLLNKNENAYIILICLEQSSLLQFGNITSPYVLYIFMQSGYCRKRTDIKDLAQEKASRHF